MYDNKVRLSQDILEKAELIASEWGLKNARAAVEAVFRRYADDYLQRDRRTMGMGTALMMNQTTISDAVPACEALDELDDLLGM
jgi:hypothetical protein